MLLYRGDSVLKNLIITADWHLRDDRPRCRPKDEDWMKLQEDSVALVYARAFQYNADICICGDIFHYDTVSNTLLNIFLRYSLNAKKTITYILPGQHDMKYRSWGTLFETSYGILLNIAKQKSTQLRLMDEVGMEAPFGFDTFRGVENGLYFTHILCVPNKISFLNNGIYTGDLLDKYPKAQIIFAGDNHHGFVYRDRTDCRSVAVPGCLNRQSFDLQDYKPGVLLYSKDDDGNYSITHIENEMDTVNLVEDNYTEKKELKDESVSAFVESLKGISQKKFTLSFLDNLKKAIEEDTLDNECVGFIQEIINEVKK